MELLTKKLENVIATMNQNIKAILAEHGEKQVSTVNLSQVFGGLRGSIGLFCDTSSVKADEGLFVRGQAINDLVHHLPEEIFYLLLTGTLPNNEELTELRDDINANAHLPDYVAQTLKCLPANSHPMTMFNLGILAMQNESIFNKKYAEGIPKTDYWKYALQDAIRLMAVTPSIAAAVYRIKFCGGELIPYDTNLDWGTNYARMLGIPDANNDFANLIKLYLVLHCDHEGGNASAYTNSVIDSTLSDVYYSTSGAFNALAGPLHGLANQETLNFILEMQKTVGDNITEETISKYAQDTLAAGRVIPGFGHAVLRVTDPRFNAFETFAKEHCPDSPMYQMVSKLTAVVPNILLSKGKVTSPWPNVDCISGSLIYHYGLTQTSYYTVFFGVSRVMGLLAQSILNRGIRNPITRPKSIDFKWINDNIVNK